MPHVLTDAELEAYLDEGLPAERMAEIEAQLRSDPKLLERLAMAIGRRDAGVHSLGEIWRRHRASCPTREQLGSLLLGVLDEPEADYIKFHLKTIGCRYCEANLADLARRHEESGQQIAHRQQKYFQSSAGYLRKR